MNEPRIVIADEPTGNLDTATGREIVELLFRLRANRGITIVIGTHDPNLAHACDDVISIRDGRVAPPEQPET
jgi:putative ABC transport system ATP-binding protein